MFLSSLVKSFFILTLLGTIFIILIEIKDDTSELNKMRPQVSYNNFLAFTYVIGNKVNNSNTGMNKSGREKRGKPGMKYILQWSLLENHPLIIYIGLGQTVFIKNKCANINCIVTNNKTYFDDITKFDVILFHGPEIVVMSAQSLPKQRAAHQKYVFSNMESADNYPVCNFNNYFNWTWTYRLDSEVIWGYIAIRNDKDEWIGPKIDMHWMKIEDMDPVSDEIRDIVKTKRKAAAWFVSNCNTNSLREVFAAKLQKELKKYNLTVDIFGKCGPRQCAQEIDVLCKQMLSRDYYFYLSFENSFSKYYVTEKLLIALENDVVPIVYGGANYTRFMPDGIYLNAREIDVQGLAETMNELINDEEKYLSYFKWRKHYKYHRMKTRPDSNEYCNMCKILHNEEKMKEVTVIKNLDNWWNPPNYDCSKMYL